MYFIGYSKWLLLSSRLVAGDALAHLHAYHKTTPESIGCVSARCEA